MHRIPQTAGMTRPARDLTVFRTVQSVATRLHSGAAHRAQMDKSLRFHNATSARAAAGICSQCCGEARIETAYKPGVGRIATRVCTKPACAWCDDLHVVHAEPEIPTGKGSFSVAATLAYIKARSLCLQEPQTLFALLEPIAKATRHSVWKRHWCNAHTLVADGVLVQDGETGATATPLYRLSDCASGKGGCS